MIKKSLLLSFIIVILTGNFSYAKKHNIPPFENAASVDTIPNPYGILVSESNGYNIDPPDAANLAHDLGVAYARIAVSNGSWYIPAAKQKFLDEYNAYTKSSPSIKILLNVNWGEHAGGPEPFPGATPQYQAFIKDLTDTLTSPGYVPPAVIVVENEENNVQFHLIQNQADQDKYIEMLASDAVECHKKNLKVCNGAITDIGVVLTVWDYFLNTLHDTARADTFLNNSMPQRSIARIYTPFYQGKLNRAKYFLNAYKFINIDYVNIHWYEPIKLADWYYADRATDIDTAHISQGSLEEVFAYFDDSNTEGGKPLMVNEAGQITPANEITQELTCAMQGLPYVIWYDGDRDEFQSIRPYRQWGLHTSLSTGTRPYAIRPNGYLFRDNIANIIANPFVYCVPFQNRPKNK